jgi:hypothetical protein
MRYQYKKTIAQAVKGSIPGRDRDFPLPHYVHTVSGTKPDFYPTEREAVDKVTLTFSPPCSAEVKMESSSNPHMPSWHEEDNLSFTFYIFCLYSTPLFLFYADRKFCGHFQYM